MSPKNKVFLLDAYALLYRAYYAFIKNPRINSKGQNTSAIFGFTNTLLELLEKHKPTHLCVCFDPPEEKSERGVLYEEYKANRQAMPEDLRDSVPYVFELLEAMRIRWVMENGYEADDVIATLAKRFAGEDAEVYIVTSDKDLAQLVGPGIYWYKPGRMGYPDEILDAPKVCEKFGIDNPAQVVDLLALMGDTSDNIPGIPGVGEKTAMQLLKEFGSVKNVLKNAGKLRGKLREKVESGKELAMLSYQLASVIDDAPLSIKLQDLKVLEPDHKKLRELFERLEFRRLEERLLGPQVVPQVSSVQGVQRSLFAETAQQSSTYKTLLDTPHNYQLITTAKELAAWVEKLRGKQTISFDTETDGLDSLEAGLVGVSISWEPHHGIYVAIPEEKAEAQKMLSLLRELLGHPSLRKVAHNLKFDLSVLRSHGVEVVPPYEDTMLMHYIIDPEGRHGMDALSRALLNYDPVPIESLIGKRGKGQSSMRQVSTERVAEYSAEDADITLQLYQALLPMLKERGGVRVYREIELPLVPVLEDMERTGVALDVDYLKQLSRDFDEEAKNLEREIFELTGTQFNIASPKQLGEVLFERLKLNPQARRTGKTKQYATGEDILESLAHKHPVVSKVLEWREIQKLKSTYIDALPQMVNPHTGRVHTSFNQTITATGRLSSANPNLQNIPIRTERGQKIRRAVVASRPDHMLLSVDYSQVELRIIASLSGEEHMIEAFQQGHDIHASTASRLFGVPLEKVTKDMRGKAKMVNFGIIYGITAFGLAQRTGLSRTEAKAIIEEYFKQYPRIQEYINRQIAVAREQGYVETLFGRRRYLRDINSANPTVRGFAERNAINAPIQGTAADIIKLAMVQIYQTLKQRGFATKLVLQVHDELVLDGPAQEMDEVEKITKHLMQNACPLRVPLEVHAGRGSNWLEAH
ncbi:MAG: DNA polymerase I [Flavobacteriales bacterium]|nr:DNA polymerase I [Flavobacteriales bacterium]MCX7767499.1 DNA polymerase I [Flavobacteriales bacterium]MDW8409634.1 DNA polymerase I [Flavobacteriales bacterium]